MGGSYNEKEQPHKDKDSDDDSDNDLLTGMLVFLGLCAFTGFLITLAVVMKDPPEYSIAIADASGLDSPPAAAAFNVTVRVTSRSVWDDDGEVCLDPATTVRVSYLGVPLVAGCLHRRLCAPPSKSAELAVVAARGEVPGYLLDCLAEDIRAGEAVFEVTLMTPHGDGGGHWKMRTCWGRIGDAATLDHACAES